MTDAQTNTLERLCARYGVEFKPEDFRPTSRLPSDWVGGWVGACLIYVGCDPEGNISS